MFPDTPRETPLNGSARWSALEDSKTMSSMETTSLRRWSVVIISTPGHTPGHQSLFVKLKKTGPVVLSGDLYHYPAERTLRILRRSRISATSERG